MDEFRVAAMAAVVVEEQVPFTRVSLCQASGAGIERLQSGLRRR